MVEKKGGGLFQGGSSPCRRETGENFRERDVNPNDSFKTPWSKEIAPGGPFQRINKKNEPTIHKKVAIGGKRQKSFSKSKESPPRLADEQSRKIGQRCQTGTCAPSVDCCFHRMCKEGRTGCCGPRAFFSAKKHTTGEMPLELPTRLTSLLSRDRSLMGRENS